LIGDISRAIGERTSDYAAAFMGVLLENLQSEVLNRNVKIPILACFGDIALAIGAGFEVYLEHTMGVLRQAGSLQPNPMDYDLMDYVNSLREGILDAYVGIVTGFKTTDKGTPSSRDLRFVLIYLTVGLLLPHVPSMLELIRRTLNDEEHTAAGVTSSYGLLGDLADTFHKGEIKSLLLADWVAVHLKNKRNVMPEARTSMKYAREVSCCSI
jgi:importin subunit beta-1